MKTISLKLLRKAIQVNGVNFPCRYSHNPSRVSDGRECVTVYATSYEGFPKDLKTRNDSDINQDYFETDKHDIFKGEELFEQALTLCK